MSLRTFHIVFISITTLAGMFCGIWGVLHYRADGGEVWMLAFGLMSLASSVALIFYGNWFMHKLYRSPQSAAMTSPTGPDDQKSEYATGSTRNAEYRKERKGDSQ